MMMVNSTHDRYSRAAALRGVRPTTARFGSARRGAGARASEVGRVVSKPAPRCAAELAGAPAGDRLNQQILDNQI